ncbi:DUF4124 domain-containing protein [Alteromonas gilva]|uniref:DUF4124 domain-containing protein n=1 Tax=Alteromonas gilva TaxID=2987522 RepID=A0ABT5L650_9ALTE|nr:DUF4124 domain-containing protein [Alteromonas gilva]MDC8832525.1 DUF4124 domain-containing protein [Alteromonas gilva]
MKRLFLLFSLCLAPAYAQQVYKVVNQDGSVTYTDKPLPGAQPVQLGPLNQVAMPTPQITPRVTRQTSPATPKPQLEVLSPADEATVRNNSGNMQIAVKVTHPDTDGRYHLYMDGALLKEQSTPVFQVEGINRGAHTFYIEHTDNKGKTLASTTPRTFYLHQASRLINP